MSGHRDLPNRGWGKPPIDKVNAVVWTALIIAVVGFWSLVGYAIWRWVS